MVFVFLAVACVDSLRGESDKLFLRNEAIMEGAVSPQGNDSYIVSVSGKVEIVPKAAVKFVLYGDPQKASKIAGLDQARELCKNPSLASVRILPTDAFGEEILKIVDEARHSIHIFTYFISGAQGNPIQSFYEKLKQKAQAGVDVTIISEFGSGTQGTIKDKSLNFSEELERSGIHVLFIQEQSVQHKKMILVDGRKVIVGSSNLTLAGTRESDEMNVAIESPAFAEQAAADFDDMKKQAHSYSELKF